ncbi:hypothetical protein L7F22_014733 [Adiantum nelumboides]|nr:hypothetical protein [Adiantum nelumboides]
MAAACGMPLVARHNAKSKGGFLRKLLHKLNGADRLLLSEERVRFFTRALVEAVQELHEQGVVHGDIKSGNVLLRRRQLGKQDNVEKKKTKKTKRKDGDDVGDYDVKLADFGVSRVYEDKKSGWIDSGCGLGGDVRAAVAGTLTHMAPEVAAGRGAGRASDVWSVGCTVVEMMQGYGPLGAHRHGGASPAVAGKAAPVARPHVGRVQRILASLPGQRAPQPPHCFPAPQPSLPRLQDYHPFLTKNMLPT